jgi:uncharacterized protein YdaU (DUF1376 family)
MSNRDLPMMPWFPQDFAGATSAWTFVERALYRSLLDAQWTLGVLPDDETRLARVAGIEIELFREAWAVVSEKFERVAKGLKNQRLEDHRKKAQALVEQRANAAQASVQARRERALNERSNARSTNAEHPSPSPPRDKTKKEPLRGSKESNAKRLPEDFALTPERIEIAKAEKVDPQRTFQKFTDHWLAAGGANARKRDWDAAWRNWCRNDHDRNHGPNGNGTHRPGQAPVSSLERVKQATDEWLEDRRRRRESGEGVENVG